MAGISVVILTRNEEQDLPACLASLAWCDDIHVFDSCSDDATVDIAVAAGARVTKRAFDDWSSHQNWGLRNLPFKHPWVYYSDADERVTPELAAALAAAVADPADKVAFRIRRRDYLDGTWLKHVTPSPFNIRLFRPEAIHYERLINPLTCVDGPVGEIEAHFDHFPFSKGMDHWFAKHNRYSALEARQIVQNRAQAQRPSWRAALFASDLNQRRAHQKALYYTLPLRPVLMFLVLYVLKLGFLDGRAGLRFCILRAIYEYMIVLKTRELAQAEHRP